jgi:hypothetical protein
MRNGQAIKGNGPVETALLERYVPGSLWRLPAITVEMSWDMDNAYADYGVGSIIEMVKVNSVNVDNCITCEFRLLFGSVPKWWFQGEKANNFTHFTLSMPLTQRAASALAFVPEPMEEETK